MGDFNRLTVESWHLATCSFTETVFCLCLEPRATNKQKPYHFQRSFTKNWAKSQTHYGWYDTHLWIPLDIVDTGYCLWTSLGGFQTVQAISSFEVGSQFHSLHIFPSTSSKIFKHFSRWLTHHPKVSRSHLLVVPGKGTTHLQEAKGKGSNSQLTPQEKALFYWRSKVGYFKKNISIPENRMQSSDPNSHLFFETVLPPPEFPSIQHQAHMIYSG